MKPVLTADAGLLDLIGLKAALALRCVPLGRVGAVTRVALAEDAPRGALAALEPLLGPIAEERADADEIGRAVCDVRADAIGRLAERRTPLADSCRRWSGRRAGLIALAALSLLALAIALWPAASLLVLTAWAAATLVAVTGLRTLAALVEARHARRLAQRWRTRRRRPARDALPRISLLIPLFDEREIAARLIRRIDRLDYPRDRLEILLILEAGDRRTRAALAETALPPEARVITVPPGELRTKPRAMNFALGFARGEIIGIYDAEDAPERDQLLAVADGFAKAGPDVACLQGVLDFYNARQTWLTRCFTIDYALWFRLVLPGLTRLGMLIPLGGTTVFLRREAVEKLGAWDAHNVTEDADLGVRLARRGYRVAFIRSVTREEATATTGAWLRQRSRWIKGYAITWSVHMRRPLALWRELGPWRFLGFQILFFGTLSQFVLAPVLWSFWLVLFGLPHPVVDAAPPEAVLLLGGLFLLSEIATLGFAALAVATPRRRWLIKWVPAITLYHLLAAVASWKAFAELVSRPFFWDKTAHGQSAAPRARRLPWRPFRRPA